MTQPIAWRQDWDRAGVRLALYHERKVLPLSQWGKQVPGLASLVLHYGTGDALVLTHRQVAQLTNYDAKLLGLPFAMEAALVVEMEGRIDHPAFALAWRLEPRDHLHPLTRYTREGARILIGDRAWRVNPYQLALFEALETMRACGDDVAQRLRCWPALVNAMHAPNHQQIVVHNALPHIQVTRTEQLPATAMTRVGEALKPVSAVADATWAMLPHHKYFVRPA